MLHEVTRILLQPNKKEITTYKILRRIGTESFSSMFFNTRKTNLDFFIFPPIGEWISCYDDYINNDWPNINLTSIEDKIEYPTGFHCCLKLDEVKEVYSEFKKSEYLNILL